MRAVKILVMSALLVSVSACNTVQGAGKDIESVGKKGGEILKGKKG